jgi:hypothetical protein
MSGLNQIDRAAFAAENAAVTKQIENIAQRKPAPAEVQHLASELANAGVPMAAAHILARRMAAGVPHELSLHVARLEGRIIELERELKVQRQPYGVERR